MTIMTKQQNPAYDDFCKRAFGEKKLNNMEDRGLEEKKAPLRPVGDIEPGLFMCSRPERK